MSDDVSSLHDDISPHSRQLERESEMVRKGIERYRQTELQHAEAGQHGQTQVGRGILGRIMKAFIPVVEELQGEALKQLVSTGKDLHKWVVFLSIDAEYMAYITALSVFSFRKPPDVDDEDEDEDDSAIDEGVTGVFEPISFLMVAMDVGRQVIQERLSDVRRDERWQEHLLREAKEEEEKGEPLLAMEKLESVVDIGGHVLPKKEQRFINAEEARDQIKKLKKLGCASDPERQPKKPNTFDVTLKVDSCLSNSKSSLTKVKKKKRLDKIRESELSLLTLNLRSVGKDKKGFTSQQLAVVGGELVELLIQTCPDLFELIKKFESDKHGKKKKTSPKKANFVALKPLAAEKLMEEHARRELERPWRTAMVCSPAPWEYDTNKNDYIGGYLQVKLPLISHQQRRRHTTDLDNPISAQALNAINAIQSTSWRINQRLLEVVTKLLSHPEGSRLDLPVQLSVDEENWTHDRRTIQRTLEAADELRGEGKFWFPHFMDFRGRIYPYPQDLHPQLGDAPRALLEFADGKPLGANGRGYLASHIASLYSKEAGTSRDEQSHWVEKHTNEIRSLVKDPLKEIEFWRGAGDPWRFLAGCIEWDRLHEQGEQVFRSHMPILMDGTCNGLQHLAALTGDPQLAQSVNLTSGDRGDIYMDVANAVTEWLKAEVDPQKKETGRIVAPAWCDTRDNEALRAAHSIWRFSEGHRGSTDQGARGGATSSVFE